MGVGGLLEQQVRHRAPEGVGWGFGFDDRLEVAEFWVEATKEVEDLARLRDGVTDVPELISETFEFGAVIVDGEIALLHTAKLCLQENSPLKFVVTEVAFNIRPEREGGDARLVDKIEDVGGDGGVDPVDDATIDLPPLGVALSDWRRGADMVLKTKLAQHRVETAPPLAVVGGGVVEDDGNVVADVHCLNDRGRGWLRRSGAVEFAVVGGRGGVSWGVSHGCGSRRNRGGKGGRSEWVGEGGSFGV
jgi:hypothetical protein